MFLKFYRQKATEIQREGFTFYSGEDGRPYVDDRLIMVADGLGGTGAIRHSKINPGVLDEDTALHTFFSKDMYEHLDDERMVSYFKSSFRELFLLKDNYCKTPHAYKKSGYIGSRITTFIVLYHALFDERFNPEKLFGDYEALDDAAKADFEKALGETMTDIIKTELHQVAENANIIRETEKEKLEVMATTLCSTIYLEHDDYVEAFYFVVGDSRPYVWTCENGLQQVIGGQEGNAGAMLDCICEGGKFSVVCEYHKFAKPCVLFNASDGCFDSVKFNVSPLGFEKLVLDAFAESGSLEETEQRLISEFDEYGTHDDSSTMALSSFGYASFEDLQDACKRRLFTINDEYLSKFEGLLDVKYTKLYDDLVNERRRKLVAFRLEFEKEEAVWEYCAKKVLEECDGKLELEPDDEVIAAEKEKIKTLKKEIYDIISADLVAFIDAVKIDKSSIAGGKLDESEKCRKKIIKLSAAHRSMLEELVAEFDTISPVIHNLLSDTLAVGMPRSLEDFGALDFSDATELSKKLANVQEFLLDMRKKKRDINNILTYIKCYEKWNNQIIEKNPELLKNIYKELINENLTIPKLILNQKDTERFMSLIRQTVESLKAIKNSEKLRYDAALEKAKRNYWKQNIIAIMTDMVNDPESGINEDLRGRVSEMISGIETKMSEIEEKAKLQASIVEAYESNYNKIMRGE